MDGLLHVTARDDLTGETILDDDVSFGISRNKRELVKMAKNVETSVDTGRFDPARSQASDDPEVVEPLQRARSKVIPLLEEDEALPLRAIASRLEAGTDD